MRPLLSLLRLWDAEAPLLLLGAAVSLLAVGAGAGLAVTAGQAAVPAALGGAVLLWALRGLGGGRVMLRYAERNPVRANLVRPAENWKWSSARHWQSPGGPDFLVPGPVRRPKD